MADTIEEIEKRVNLDERLLGIEETLANLNRDAVARVEELLVRVKDMEKRQLELEIFATKLSVELDGLKSDLIPVAPWLDQRNCPKCGRKGSKNASTCKHCQNRYPT